MKKQKINNRHWPRKKFFLQDEEVIMRVRNWKENEFKRRWLNENGYKLVTRIKYALIKPD